MTIAPTLPPEKIEQLWKQELFLRPLVELTIDRHAQMIADVRQNNVPMLHTWGTPLGFAMGVGFNEDPDLYVVPINRDKGYYPDNVRWGPRSDIPIRRPGRPRVVREKIETSVRSPKRFHIFDDTSDNQEISQMEAACRCGMGGRYQTFVSRLRLWSNRAELPGEVGYDGVYQLSELIARTQQIDNDNRIRMERLANGGGQR